MESPLFDFDAMLMLGWVADANYRVHRLNAALRDWMKEHASKALLEADSAEGLSIEEFLKDTLALPPGVLSEIVKRLQAIPEDITKTPIPKSDTYSVDGVEISTQIRPTDEHLLVGVRAVAVGGFSMASKDIEDRVDLITVCHTKRGDDGVWHVTGYQGQLQSAWLRVEPIVREGTKSGSVALMGRNLSHNIGSHALYWLEQDVRAENATMSRFYKYLRERMELLAGFATSMPLSPRTINFGTLIDDFSKNTELTSRLCKSEGVTSITVDIRKADRGHRISVPGGSIGMQAFHSILENIIRDCAKYGKHAGTMHVGVHLDEASDYPGDDYLRVRVMDDCGAEVVPVSAVKLVGSALGELRIADEAGRLMDGFWGIKERFIAAALLRGIRVESLAVPEEDGPNHEKRYKANWNLNRKPSGEPKILNIVDTGNSLVWEFYVLKAKEVLVIAESITPGDEPAGTFDLHSMQWLKNNIKCASSIRHRFVVLIPEKLDDLRWIVDNRERFPFRTFLGGKLSTTPEGRAAAFACLDEQISPERRFEPEELYRQWIQTLDPTLNERYMLVATAWDKYKIGWRSDEWETISQPAKFQELLLDRNCLGLIRRHWDEYSLVPEKGLYYEAYSGSDSLDAFLAIVNTEVKYALFEAALIRVLLVDERIDASADEIVKEPMAQGCTIRRRFELKGITIHGTEYSGRSIPDKSELIRWATGQGKGYYHFICIHRGILDKLERLGQKPAEVCAELKTVTPNLLIHSGRAGVISLLEGLKFIPLSNVSAWMDSARGKWEVVDELCHVRRTS